MIALMRFWCALVGHRWIWIATIYRVCRRCEVIDPLDWRQRIAAYVRGPR